MMTLSVSNSNSKDIQPYFVTYTLFPVLPWDIFSCSLHLADPQLPGPGGVGGGHHRQPGQPHGVQPHGGCGSHHMWIIYQYHHESLLLCSLCYLWCCKTIHWFHNRFSPTSAFTFKTLLRHYAKQTLTNFHIYLPCLGAYSA